MATSGKSASASSSKTLNTECSSTPRDASSKAAFTAQCHRLYMHIVIVVVAVSIAFLIVLVVLHYKGKDIEQDGQPKNATEVFQDGQLKNGTETNPKECQTEACVTAGKSLFSSINYTAKPCDDFYEYACGNWMAKHPIPKTSTFISVRSQIEEKQTREIHELLAQGMTNKSKGPVAKSVQFAMDFYRECMDVETRTKQSLKTLKKLIYNVLGTSWPILDQQFKPKTDVFVETLARFKTYTGTPIMMILFKSERGSVVTMIKFNAHHGLDLKGFHCADRKKYAVLIEAVRKQMFEFGKLFAGTEVDEKILQTRVDEMLQLECNLLKETPAATNQTSSKMTIAELNNRTLNRIDWLAFLRIYTAPLNLSYSFNSTEQVLVPSIAYYQMLSQLLVNTPSHVLYNYMSFQLARTYDSAIPQLRTINHKTLGAARGITERRPEWDNCYRSVRFTMPWVLSRLYVETILAPGTKERTKEMITDLKVAFIKMIQNEVEWLDEATRARALEKAAVIKFLVAYPDWIYDNAVLDERHGFTEQNWPTVKKGKHLEAWIEVRIFNMVYDFRKLREPQNVSLEFKMDPIENNAMATMTTNAITLPAGKLSLPYFEPDYPAYLNYGGIGITIGHELTHFFDVAGSQYDKNGKIANWWTNETRKHFSAGSECFVKQYGSVVDKDTGLELNGVKSLGENIADNGGMRTAFFAFKLHAKKSPQPLLPQMEAFTSEQLFFLATAYPKCSNMKFHELSNQIKTDGHLPERHRVNVPLSNFEEFAKAFNCPVGSAMNPVTKCQLW